MVDRFVACLLHCCHLWKEPGDEIWSDLEWALDFPKSNLAVSVPNSARVDCGGSIVGKSIALSLADPYEQLVGNLTVAEHTSTGLEKVKL